MAASADGPVLEIRTYQLRPGMARKFEALFRHEGMPLLERYGIEVVGHAQSLVEEDQFVLVRAFRSLAEHREQDERFYTSDDWRLGPRAQVMECIESYHTVVLPLSGEIATGIAGRARPARDGLPPPSPSRSA